MKLQTLALRGRTERGNEMACNVYVLIERGMPEAVYTNEEGGVAAMADRVSSRGDDHGIDLITCPFKDGPPGFKLSTFGNEAKRFYLKGGEARHV